ncbi:MAG: hypothetical protein GY854_00710 [Deltaproteobacteria bacterium]|nr:hypothetical protein [Deltaproteobacteria bacterium]
MKKPMLVVDCPGAITDIPVEAADAGCKSEVTQIADGQWRITVKLPSLT